MIYEYPALFYADEDKIAFHFYDIENLHSFGDNLDEAILAAQELLADYFLYLDGTANVATPIELVMVKPLQVVKLISADVEKYRKELAAQENRDTVLNAENPIAELLRRRQMKVKELSDLLECPYRTVQDWNLGKSKPPAWVLKLIVNKILN